MKYFTWNHDKNRELIEARKISFERVVQHIQTHGYLDIIRHPNVLKYPHQKIFILNIEEYAYLVPFVESETHFFLKTIIPSRKATKKYIKERL
ncbi:MAG: toxin [Methyloprofundus sp.]|nr:toxin [Methyloprofundus sp.]